MTRPIDDHPPRSSQSAPPAFAPRYFLDTSARVEADRIVVIGRKAHRLKRVMRVRRGDVLELLHAGHDRLYRVEVERVTRDDVHCRIVACRPLRPLPPPPIVLSASLIRPQRYDFIIEKATELGVDEIRPVWSQRALIRGDATTRLARWRRIATEAAEQCRREDRPQIHPPVEVSELVAATPPPGSLCLLASALEPDRRIADVFRARQQMGMPGPEQVHLLIGPEGGYTPEESSLARERGWQPISLGNRPLRAETAAIVAVVLTLEALRE